MSEMRHSRFTANTFLLGRILGKCACYQDTLELVIEAFETAKKADKDEGNPAIGVLTDTMKALIDEAVDCPFPPRGNHAEPYVALVRLFAQASRITPLASPLISDRPSRATGIAVCPRSKVTVIADVQGSLFSGSPS